MSGFRVLDLVKPFSPFLPEVIAPERKVQFQQRVMWTIITLLIFLVMSEIPLYGIASSDSSDPLFWLRMMLASNRGTLMELGISPIVSSGMLFQLLQGTKIIHVDMQNKTIEKPSNCSKIIGYFVSCGSSHRLCVDRNVRSTKLVGCWCVFIVDLAIGFR